MQQTVAKTPHMNSVFTMVAVALLALATVACDNVTRGHAFGWEIVATPDVAIIQRRDDDMYLLRIRYSRDYAERFDNCLWGLEYDLGVSGDGFVADVDVDYHFAGESDGGTVRAARISSYWVCLEEPPGGDFERRARLGAESVALLVRHRDGTHNAYRYDLTDWDAAMDAALTLQNTDHPSSPLARQGGDG